MAGVDVPIKELYLLLLTEGWTPPHMARQRDYPDRAELKAADQAASKANCESLERALAAVKIDPTSMPWFRTLIRQLAAGNTVDLAGAVVPTWAQRILKEELIPERPATLTSPPGAANTIGGSTRVLA